MGLGKACTRSSAPFRAVFPDTAAGPATILAAEPTHRVRGLVLVHPEVPYMTGEPKVSVATSRVLQYTFTIWHQLVVV